jgi:hypothetical protein
MSHCSTSISTWGQSMRLLDMARLACYDVLYISMLTFIYHCATFNFLSPPSVTTQVPTQLPPPPHFMETRPGLSRENYPLWMLKSYSYPVLPVSRLYWWRCVKAWMHNMASLTYRKWRIRCVYKRVYKPFIRKLIVFCRSLVALHLKTWSICLLRIIRLPLPSAITDKWRLFQCEDNDDYNVCDYDYGSRNTI